MDAGGMSRGMGRIQGAVLAHLQGESVGVSPVDGAPLLTSITRLARVVYDVTQPSDAQRAAVRRAVRRLEAHGLVEVQRRGVGRTYLQRRAHPRRTWPRTERRLGLCTGDDDCKGCTAGDRPSTYFDTDVVAMFIEHYGGLTEGDRQLWRATLHGWHLYAVQLPRPGSDYRTYDVEVTELCARRALTDDEQAQAEQRLSAFLAPHVAAIRAARRHEN